MGALAPSPEDAKKQEDGANHLANPTHSLEPNALPLSVPPGRCAEPVDDLWIMRLPARP